MNANVQFTDTTKATIMPYFGAPQDPAAFPNQGTVAPTDARWSTFYKSLPDLAKAGIPAGLAV